MLPIDCYHYISVTGHRGLFHIGNLDLSIDQFDDEQDRLAYTEARNRLRDDPQMDSDAALLLFLTHPYPVQIARVHALNEGTEDLIQMVTGKMLYPGNIDTMPRMQAWHQISLQAKISLSGEAGPECALEWLDVLRAEIVKCMESGKPLTYSVDLDRKLIDTLIPGRESRKAKVRGQFVSVPGWGGALQVWTTEDVPCNTPDDPQSEAAD